MYLGNDHTLTQTLADAFRNVHRSSFPSSSILDGTIGERDFDWNSVFVYAGDRGEWRLEHRAIEQSILLLTSSSYFALSFSNIWIRCCKYSGDGMS